MMTIPKHGPRDLLGDFVVEVFRNADDKSVTEMKEILTKTKKTIK